MTFECARGQHNSCEHPEPHACACEGQVCSDVRDTTILIKMCVRQGVLSTCCVNSGEANISMLCFSFTSEDTSVVVTSSPESYVDPKLALLDGKSICVTSVLLLTVTLGS